MASGAGARPTSDYLGNSWVKSGWSCEQSVHIERPRCQRLGGQQDSQRVKVVPADIADVDSVTNPALRAPQTADGLAADPQPMLFPQLLSQMAVVEAHVQRGHQLGDGLSRLGIQAPGRGPAPTTMSESRRPSALKSPPQPPGLAQAELQRVRDLSCRHPAGAERLEQPGALQLPSAQREGLHRGRTFSRSRYPRTFSCSNSKRLQTA